MRMQPPAATSDWPPLGDLLLLMLVVATATATCLFTGATCYDVPKSAVTVSPRTESPGNPDLHIVTGRDETTYAGPLDPLQKRPRVLNAFTGKFEVHSGQSQCFYAILMPGYYWMQDAQTVKFHRDDKFDVFISNGKGHVIAAEVQVSAFKYQTIINDTDTYESCIVNQGQPKMIAYSAYRFIPPELLSDDHGLAKVHNFSDKATVSIGQLELGMAKVLASVRSHSEVYKDTAALIATNGSIQLRAWITVALQLASLAATTCFIRRLFNQPVGKMAVAT